MSLGGTLLHPSQPFEISLGAELQFGPGMAMSLSVAALSLEPCGEGGKGGLVAPIIWTHN